MEPQIARCVSLVHAFVTRPAFRHTVTTTYYKKQKKYCHRKRHTKNCRLKKISEQLTQSHKYINYYNRVVVLFRMCKTAFLTVLVRYPNTKTDTKNLDSNDGWNIHFSYKLCDSNCGADRRFTSSGLLCHFTC